MSLIDQSLELNLILEEINDKIKSLEQTFSFIPFSHFLGLIGWDMEMKRICYDHPKEGRKPLISTKVAIRMEYFDLLGKLEDQIEERLKKLIQEFKERHNEK